MIPRHYQDALESLLDDAIEERAKQIALGVPHDWADYQRRVGVLDGLRRAKEIILTAKPFSAQQAAEWGLVNRICEPGELMNAALETARIIAGNAPLSVRQAKKSIHFGLQMELKTAYRFEVEAYNHLIETEDRYEGIRAFNEKRKPVFKGK